MSFTRAWKMAGVLERLKGNFVAKFRDGEDGGPLEQLKGSRDDGQRIMVL